MEVIITKELQRGGQTVNDDRFYLDIEGLKIEASVTRLKYYPDDRNGTSSITIFAGIIFIAKIEVFHDRPWIHETTIWDYIEDMGQQVITLMFMAGK